MSAFRTVELSNPQFESSQLRFLTVKSQHLRGRGDICLFVPRADGPLPLVTMLHGVYGSSWAWSQNGGLHRTAARLIDEGAIPAMVIAMPSDGLWGDGSGYLPHVTGHDFERWIVDDVPTAVQEVLPEVSEASPRFIGGLSMGGYGAMRLGAKYAERYRGISSHSAPTSLEGFSEFTEESLSSSTAGPAHHVVEAIVTHRASLPPLRFDCGRDDVMFAQNEELHRELTRRDIAHSYDALPGAHDWEYWSAQVERSLRFFAEQL